MTQPSAQHITSTMDRLKIDGMRWRTRMANLSHGEPAALAARFCEPRLNLELTSGRPLTQPARRRPRRRLADEAEDRAAGTEANPVARMQRHLLRHRPVV